MPWVLIAAVAVVVIGIALWAWLVNDDDSAGPERGVTVEQIADSDAFDDDGFSNSLVGRQVTVSGNVSDIVGRNALRLGGDDFGGDGILVIQASGAGAGITEGDNVRVTGTVRDYEAAAFNRELGSDAFDDNLYNPWVEENVLVASTVTKLNSSG